MDSRYVVISPCRDEGEYCRRTLESVVSQSVRPALWLIVDDGSRDATPQILAEYAARHDFIRVLQHEDRGARSVGPGVIEAFEYGLAAVDLRDFDYLCKLDLDLDLPPEYFEGLMQRMAAEPRLGTCSGKPYTRTASGRLVSESIGDETSAGMTKFYRVECFAQIGGFVRSVMWDGIDCHRCRQQGWIACSWNDAELRFEHLRPIGTSEKGVLRGRMRHGRGQYFMGTGLGYMTASSAFRMTRRPWIVGGLAMQAGYMQSMLRRVPRYQDPEFRKFLRRFQRRSLWLGKKGATQRLHAELPFPGGDAALTTDADRSSPPTVDLRGVRVHRVTQAECVARVMRALAAGRGGWIVTPNLDHLRRLESDAGFRALYAQADLRVADGMPLIWASALLGERLPERVAGSDLVLSLSRAAAAEGRSVFLLGGDVGTAVAAAAELVRRFPGLRVAGIHYPPPGFERDPHELEALRAALSDAAPDVVLVALGSPRQEQVICDLRAELPAAWWVGVGISFSFVTGAVRRAPVWLQRLGMEWLHRLAQEPRRLRRRYITQGIPFALRLLWSSVLERGQRRRGG